MYLYVLRYVNDVYRVVYALCYLSEMCKCWEVYTNTLFFSLSTEKAPRGASYNIQVVTCPTEGENMQLNPWRMDHLFSLLIVWYTCIYKVTTNTDKTTQLCLYFDLYITCHDIVFHLCLIAILDTSLIVLLPGDVIYSSFSWSVAKYINIQLEILYIL